MRVCLLAALLILAGLAVWRARRTPEWSVLFGDEAARVQACRVVWMKSNLRARLTLTRLLADRDPRVRIAALEALERCPALHPTLGDRAADLADSADPEVRTRALEFLFAHPDQRLERWLEPTRVALMERDYRHAHPNLLRLHLEAQASRQGAAAAEWAWALISGDPLQAPDPLLALAAHPDALRPLRARLLAALDGGSQNQREWILRMLAAMDGRMRGQVAADWLESASVVASPAGEAPERFSIEAEWAYDIRPNFQIDQQDGEWCLHLAEGAGGYIPFAGRDNSTVDIGSASLPFTLPRDGTYQIWLRAWFGDKCGNSTGIAIDGQALGVSFPDWETTRFRTWYWERAVASVKLSAGRHTLELTAWEDNVFVDKYALLPAGETFDPERPPPAALCYAPERPGSVSITADLQMQPRGTTQKLTVWVRRSTPEVEGGTIRLLLEPPWQAVHGREAEVAFADGAPVARATFLVQVPADAPGGEKELVAELCGRDGKRLAAGRVILGVPCDWYATGPLEPDSPLCRQLLGLTRLTPETRDLSVWQRYPDAGYDRYRRLNFEKAYGQQDDKYIFLHSRIDVADTGEYVSLLTIDDGGFVYLDGQRLAGRDGHGMAEGWMQTTPVRLTAGRHDVFVWVSQQPGPDGFLPNGLVSKPNHWVFKWLLRRARHEAAPGISGPLLAEVPSDVDHPDRHAAVDAQVLTGDEARLVR